MSGECTPAEPTAACTVQVDAAEPGAKGPGGGGNFLWASSDGSRVFFTDEGKLTTDSTAGLAKPDLYEYDLETGALTDLTVDPGEHANVLGFLGASQDGSYIYFSATGVLPGSGRNSQGARALAGHPNLYLSHAGTTTYVAEANPVQPEAPTAGTSPNGAFLAFLSTAPLTGYDNKQTEAGACSRVAGELGSCAEAFEYSAATGQLTCASCDPSGAPPLGPANLNFQHRPSEGEQPLYRTRSILDDGTLFFNSPDPLLARDTNRQYDVYEYADGQPHLISSGTESQPSYFYEATPSDDDVFFITDQALVRRDTDDGLSLYDARVDGGFPEPPPPPVCEAEACRGPDSSPPTAASPATATFHGAGNEKPCPKGKLRKGGKCVKRSSRQAHKHAQRHHRRANSNRGGAK